MTGGTRGHRRWLVGCLTLAAALAALAGLWASLPEDEWEAARREPLGADREAVEAVAGRPADGVIGKSGRTAEVTRRVLFWQEGKAQLLSGVR